MPLNTLPSAIVTVCPTAIGVLLVGTKTIPVLTPLTVYKNLLASSSSFKNKSTSPSRNSLVSICLVNWFSISALTIPVTFTVGSP